MTIMMTQSCLLSSLCDVMNSGSVCRSMGAIIVEVRAKGGSGLKGPFIWQVGLGVCKVQSLNEPGKSREITHKIVI